MDAERKTLASRKIKLQDRISFLDEVQVESTEVPGVGTYNIRVSMNLVRDAPKLR
jgi:hypothetical protein